MPIKKLIASHRTFIVLAAVLLFLFLVTYRLSPAFAEISPLEKAENDYAYQYSKYVDLHENYLSAKSAYKTFQTATSKNDAYLKTKDYLKQVHSVYVSYLLLAKEIGNTFDWGDNAKNKNAIAKNLDYEINFFTENSKKIDSTQTLEELPQIASDLADHIKNTSGPLINGTVITYNLVEIQTRLKQFTNLSSELNNYAKNKLTPEKYNAFFANWNSEINKIQQSAQKDLEISTNIAKDPRKQFNSDDVADTARRTQLIQQSLNQASSLLEEVIRL